MAKSLPSQSTFFIQLVFVTTVVSCGIEILRIKPLAYALIRKIVGPNLTRKERNKRILLFRPLSDPHPFEYADFASNLVLYFVVLLVYSVISPLTNYFVAGCFVYMGAVFRHQFIYIYPAEADSGGKIWIKFIRIFLACMLIGEATSKYKHCIQTQYDVQDV